MFRVPCVALPQASGGSRTGLSTPTEAVSPSRDDKAQSPYLLDTHTLLKNVNGRTQKTSREIRKDATLPLKATNTVILPLCSSEGKPMFDLLLRRIMPIRGQKIACEPGNLMERMRRVDRKNPSKSLRSPPVVINRRPSAVNLTPVASSLWPATFARHLPE